MASKNHTLHILRYLWQHTDEDHHASTADIVSGLAAYGVSVNRHAIPAIVEELQVFGFDIIQQSGSPNRYFIGQRHFELPELKLLADAVGSSRFISEKKSQELVYKLCKLTSEHQAKALNRHLYVEGRVKSDNKTLYYTVDTLDTAINEKKRVTFQYIEYTAEKKKIHKHSGYVYEFSPYALLWHDDCYYVVGYSAKHQAITKFRVDRIDKCRLSEQFAVTKPTDFDPVMYLKNIFSMYDGEMQTVRLQCCGEMMKVILDRFGQDTHTQSCGDGTFIAKIRVSVSPTFFGWLFSLENHVRILSPDSVINAYRQALQKAVNTYTKE
jgi:predicted DNA-binding transcriptional regulator YafY